VQCLEHSHEHPSHKLNAWAWDQERTLRLFGYRLLIFGPGYTLWLKLLEKRLGHLGTSAKGVATKVALDQLVWTPPSMTAFYMWMAFFEPPERFVTSITPAIRPSVSSFPGVDFTQLEQKYSHGINRVRDCLWPTLQVNWPFWSSVGCITFGLIPPKHRILWVSTLQVGWNAFLSNLNQRARLKRGAGSICSTDYDSK
jgi:protein Mpv17